MLKKDTYKFLKTLTKNNNREWFAENKEWYEKSRSDFELLISQLIISVADFEIEFKYLDPKKCIFRIYRDTRFSQDKTPYKTHFGAVFTSSGLGKSSGYYIHIDPAGSFLTCGHYMLTPEQLKKVRQGIYDNFEEFQTIINNKEFKKEFGDLQRNENVLKRVPNDFDKEHPAAEYMKLKQFYIMKPLLEEQLFEDNFIQSTTHIYKKMQPLNDFLKGFLIE